jgi:deferrochelatase/peroxidase EfeB
VPAESLATFPSEFQQGMAARADYIGDVGESAPENWEAPLGSKDVHVVVAALARDTSSWRPWSAGAGRGPQPARRHPGLDAGRARATRRTRQFGFKDSISEPAVEGTDILGSNPHEAPLKAGEFVLGYQDERRRVPGSAAGGAGPQRHVRGLPQAAPAGGSLPRVLGQNAADDAEQEWLAAKFVGRWPSGAPLALARTRTTRTGADPHATTPSCTATTARGLKCPVGAHARRMNARDRGHHRTGARLHRMIRRVHQLWPVAAPGVLEDDGGRPRPDVRLVGALLNRQFEFVQPSGSTTASSSARPPSGTR